MTVRDSLNRVELSSGLVRWPIMGASDGERSLHGGGPPQG